MKKLYGNFKDEEIRRREEERGFITYRTLAEYVGDMVLCNNLSQRYGASLEEVQGDIYNADEDTYEEIFQWFIISDHGFEILEGTDEIVFYDNELDVYVWGITHWGTSWDYVFTDIPCEKRNW